MSCFRYFFAWFDRESGFLFSHKTCFPLFMQCIKICSIFKQKPLDSGVKKAVKNREDRMMNGNRIKGRLKALSIPVMAAGLLGDSLPGLCAH